MTIRMRLEIDSLESIGKMGNVSSSCYFEWDCPRETIDSDAWATISTAAKWNFVIRGIAYRCIYLAPHSQGIFKTTMLADWFVMADPYGGV